MNAIQLADLRKKYGSVNALDGLDLDVPMGSVFGFLGPNGAGKTTTLRLLAGLAKPDSGTITVNGEMVGSMQVHKEIGYLPEEPAFYPWMTPSEYLNFTADIFGFSAKEKKIRTAELLEMSGLKQYEKRRIGGFSRGMRQRLGLAQAMVNHPTILLLDEPVSALDPMGRKEVLEMIEMLGQNCTVLMSTHILEDVERVCDTVAILDKGRRIIQSDREELMNRYANPAMELEFNNGMAYRLDEIAKDLKELHSIQSVQINGHLLHLAVSDISAAQQEIMTLALNKGLRFERLDVVKPTLEEVFVRLVGEKEGTK